MSYQCEVCSKFLSVGDYAENLEGSLRRTISGKEKRPLPDGIVCTGSSSYEDLYDDYSFAHKLCLEKRRLK